MTHKEILSHVDHTLLSRTATGEQIRTLCEEAILYGTASVCIPPWYVKEAALNYADRLSICTVIGFPNGYHTTPVKVFEARDAIRNGASELDMVINTCLVRDRKWDEVSEELNALREATDGRILKVIIETCLLQEAEKIKLCELVSASGADYIKTSTGFSTGGATREDIALMAAYAGPNLKIKAAGGIRTWEDAEDFLNLGADRLGTSRLVKLMSDR